MPNKVITPVRPIVSIAIILGDNDFGNTFRPLLEECKRIIDYSSNTLPRETVEKIIRVSIRFFYIAYQNQYRYSVYGLEFEEEFDKMNKYLQECKILFNEDADKAYCEEDHDSGAWHLHVESGEINNF